MTPEDELNYMLYAMMGAPTVIDNGDGTFSHAWYFRRKNDEFLERLQADGSVVVFRTEAELKAHFGKQGRG